MQSDCSKNVKQVVSSDTDTSIQSYPIRFEVNATTTPVFFFFFFPEKTNKIRHHSIEREHYITNPLKNQYIKQHNFVYRPSFRLEIE